MAADTMTKKMSEASSDIGIAPPKRGDRFRCSICGMALEVTADCHCSGDKHVHFQCCDREMVKE